MNARAWFDIALLLVVAVSALLYLNRTRRRPWCERIGLAFTAGGAVGRSLELWHGFDVTDSSTVLYIGLAILAATTFGHVNLCDLMRRAAPRGMDRFIDARFSRRD